MDKYSFSVLWSDEDDAYVATVPEFPGLSAFGDTPEEAIREAKIALRGFIEVYEEDGCKLPQPMKVKKYSGQIRLRLPKSLHERLSREAKHNGVSLNMQITNTLSEGWVAIKTLEKLWQAIPVLTDAYSDYSESQTKSNTSGVG